MLNRGRLDRFSNKEYSKSIRVDARPNMTFKTEQFMDTSFKIRIRGANTDVQVEDEKMFEDFDISPFLDESQRTGHIAALQTPLVFGVKSGLVNHSIQKCYIVPQASNAQDVRPKAQLEILPYLCESAQVESIIREDGNTFEVINPDQCEELLLDGNAAPGAGLVVEDRRLEFKPAENNNLFISSHLLADDESTDLRTIIERNSSLLVGNTNKTRFLYKNVNLAGGVHGVLDLDGSPGGLVANFNDGMEGIPLLLTNNATLNTKEFTQYFCNPNTDLYNPGGAAPDLRQLNNYVLHCDLRNFGHNIAAVAGGHRDRQFITFGFDAGAGIQVRFNFRVLELRMDWGQFCKPKNLWYFAFGVLVPTYGVTCVLIYRVLTPITIKPL